MKTYAFKKTKWKWMAMAMDAVGYRLHRPADKKEITPHRILVVRLDQIGDIIQTLPLFDSVKVSYPEAALSFLTTPAGAELARINGFSDELFIWNCPWFDSKRHSEHSWRQVLRWVRSRRFDLVLEPRGDVRLITLLRAARVKNLVGYGATGGGFMLDVEAEWEPPLHAVDKNLKLVEAVGGHVATRTPKLKSDKPASPLRTLAIHPGAGTSAKRWPARRFAEVARRLSAQNVRVHLVGTDVELGQEIEQFANAQIENHMGRTTLPQLVDILKNCDGMLSNDSGPAHIMAALGRPVWVLWSGTAPAEVWSPRGEKVKLFQYGVPCAPCELPVCPVPGHPCLEQITSERVARTVATDMGVAS